MNGTIAAQIGFSAYAPTMGIYRTKDNTLQFGPNQEIESFMMALWRETMYLDNFNKEHTTTIYDKLNRPITVWNIDDANDVASQLLKQNNPALANIENMAKYGCNFMVILGYTQMLTRSTLNPTQIKDIWETAIAENYMDSEGAVSAYSKIADLSLQKLGRNDIGLNFDTYWKTYNDGTLIGHRIQVPFQTDSHYLLGDKTTDPRPNWIYDPGTTYSIPHTNNYGVRIYAK
jgi:hypothetical protein